MKRMPLLLLALPFLLHTSPWLTTEDVQLRFKLDSLIQCNVNLPNYSKFPYNLSNVYDEIENIDLSKTTNKCAALITNLKDEIHERINKSSFKLGFISSGSNKKFQDFGFRQNEDDGLFIDFGTTSSNWALKIRGIKFNDSNSDDIQLDESYISYTANNKIFSIGRMSRWWSSSWDNSLIYSNNARPSPGISFGNNLATKLDIPFLDKLGPINYELFVNQLEEHRHIPKAKLIGAYISFKPYPRLDFSLFRTGQIGGKGRPEDLETLWNFITGRDNRGDDGITENNEPGNQLAGGDFTLRMLKGSNLEIFGQIVGEDESNLLPTKTIYNLGLSYKLNFLENNNKIILEHTDTDVNSTYQGVRIQNIAYNHGIYKDGYRYYKKPIGASIDADSSKSTLTYFQELNDSSLFKFKVFKSSINENLNQKNYWGNSIKEINGYEITLHTSFGERASVFLEYLELKEEGLIDINENNLMVRLEFEIF